MDERVRERIDAKIGEAQARRSEIAGLAGSLKAGAATPYGIVAGMLYNSFYYQTRRICGREPTAEEASEFVAMLNERRAEIEKALG